MQTALRLTDYPSFSREALNVDAEYREQSELVQSLNYLVLSHHGGTNTATISYLQNVVKVPDSNIYNHCEGQYCGFATKYFQNSEQYAFLKDIVKSMMISQDATNWNNLDVVIQMQQKLNLSFRAIPKEDMLDVVICTYVSHDCAFLLPFAKVVVFRFMQQVCSSRRL